MYELGCVKLYIMHGLANKEILEAVRWGTMAVANYHTPAALGPFEFFRLAAALLNHSLLLKRYSAGAWQRQFQFSLFT